MDHNKLNPEFGRANVRTPADAFGSITEEHPGMGSGERSRKKSSKSFFEHLVVLVLAAVLTFMPLFASLDVYAAADRYVYDDAELLSDEERDTLEARAEEITDTYGCAVYILTIGDYREYGSDVFDVADVTYQESGFGYGEDRNGVMLLLSMADRSYSTYFYGPVADYAFDDYGQEEMEREFLDNFSDNDWMGGFSDYQDVVAEYLQKAADGHPVRKSHTLMLLLIAALSVIISLIICFTLRSASKNVRTAVAADYYTKGKVNLVRHSDRFKFKTTSVRHIKRSSSGGGGSTSHHSSSGGSGRSGHF